MKLEGWRAYSRAWREVSMAYSVTCFLEKERQKRVDVSLGAGSFVQIDVRDTWRRKE